MDRFAEKMEAEIWFLMVVNKTEIDDTIQARPMCEWREPISDRLFFSHSWHSGAKGIPCTDGTWDY